MYFYFCITNKYQLSVASTFYLPDVILIAIHSNLFQPLIQSSDAERLNHIPVSEETKWRAPQAGSRTQKTPQPHSVEALFQREMHMDKGRAWFHKDRAGN